MLFFLVFVNYPIPFRKGCTLHGILDNATSDVRDIYFFTEEVDKALVFTQVGVPPNVKGQSHLYSFGLSDVSVYKTIQRQGYVYIHPYAGVIIICR